MDWSGSGRGQVAVSLCAVASARRLWELIRAVRRATASRHNCWGTYCPLGHVLALDPWPSPYMWSWISRDAISWSTDTRRDGEQTALSRDHRTKHSNSVRKTRQFPVRTAVCCLWIRRCHFFPLLWRMMTSHFMGSDIFWFFVRSDEKHF